MALVLTRRPDESFLIITPDGHEVTVKVLTVKGKQVRLRIEAAKSAHILRSELEPKGQPIE